MFQPRTAPSVTGCRPRLCPISVPLRAKHTSGASSAGANGFSTLELVIALGIILTLSAIAIPSITKTVRSYQLTDAATQVASILKFTRFEAIRRNTPTSCLNSQPVANSQATLWSDNNGDGVPDPVEKKTILGANATLVPPAAAPGAAALATAVGVDTLTPLNPSGDSLRFDQRGATTPVAVYVLYIGNSAMPENGFRAVVVLPSGSVQLWTYTGGASAWQQLN